MDRNKYIKAAAFALIVAAILSLVVTIGLFEHFSETSGINLVFMLLIPVAIAFNLFAAYKIYTGNLKFIKYVLWLYIAQIVGFETSEWAFSLLLGFSLHISWSIDTVSITINLFALLMSVLLLKSMRSAIKAQCSL